MPRWDESPLGELITLQRGFDLPVQDREPGSVPIVSSSGVTGTHATARVSAPGVITGRYGTIGQVFYIADDFWPLNTTLWVKDFKGNDPRFISYLLQLVDFEAHNDKSSVPGINRNHLHLVKVPHPPLAEQRAIAHILGALDDKIELNRRMNATLEEIAGALYKSWFVDFDPVRARAAGRDPGIPPHLAALFPDTFEDSELGEIPAGWQVNPLGNLLELAYGKALKAADRHDGSIPVYGSNGQIGWHNEPLVSGPGIVVGRKGNPGVVTWVPTDFFAIDTTFYVVSSLVCPSLQFLFHSLANQDLPSLSADSAVPGLNRNLAYMNQQLIPSQSLLEEFEAIAECLTQRAKLCNDESRTLAVLRDALLPKLISGALQIGDVRDADGGLP